MLTKEFLREYANNGSQVLHITPKHFTLLKEQQDLVIEDQKFQKELLSVKDIEKLLKSTKNEEKPLAQVGLIIIELPNCKKICELFKKLGAQHVIYFNVDLDDNESDRNKFQDQLDINFLKGYMKLFSLKFYPKTTTQTLLEAKD